MTGRRPTSKQRWALTLGLFLLSPICAEYLIGYDAIMGRPLELLTGLLILGPLYGAVAVLIREVVRRVGRGWPTILLLSAAFGLIQAGVVDQSLFHLEFDTDAPEWATEQHLTPIPWLRIDAANLLNFVGGHIIWSFAAPIAVIEACAPRLAHRPWLGRPGIALMVVLYLLGAAAIFNDVVTTMAAPVQLIGTMVVALVLAGAAFIIPRRGPASPRRIPPWWLVGCVGVATFGASQVIPQTWAWAGVGLHTLVLGLLAGLLLSWSGSSLWRRTHVLAIAGAALLVRAGLSFGVEPIGDVSHSVKLASNAVILISVVGLLVLAGLRLRRAEEANSASSNGNPSEMPPVRAPDERR